MAENAEAAAAVALMEVPECTICFQVYDEQSTIPRVLSCGHTFCQICLTNFSSSSSLPQIPNTIKCPQCSSISKLPPQGPSGFPKNIDLLRLIPANAKPRKTTHPSSSLTTEEAAVPGLGFFLSNERRKFWEGWVIPGEVIVVLEGDGDVAAGVVEISWSSFRKNQKVGLLKIGIFGGSVSENGVEFSYRMKILKVLSGLTDSEMDELELVIKATAATRKLLKFYGLWMDSKGNLFLVWEKSVMGVTGIWDRFGSGFSDEDSRENSDDKEKERIWVMNVLLEICEAVMELHLQGIVLGFLSSACFEFDQFGRVLLSLRHAFDTKSRVRNSVICGSFENELSSGLGVENLFLSPEILTRLSSSESFIRPAISCPNDVYRSDVWSLACLIAEHLSGNPSTKESMPSYYSYVSEMVKGNAGVDSMELYNKWTDVVGNAMESSMQDEYKDLRNMLLRCLEHDPAMRPCVHDLWKCIKASIKFPTLNLIVDQNEPDIRCCILFADLYSSYENDRVEAKIKVKSMVKERYRCSETVSSSYSFSEIGPDAAEVAQGEIDKNNITFNDCKVLTLEGHLDCITCLAIGGGFLLSSSYDKTIGVWSLQDLSLLGFLRGHEHRVMAIVAVEINNNLCISGDSGGYICVWSLHPVPGQEPLMKWREHNDLQFSGVRCLATSTDFLYSGSGDKSIKVWSLKDFNLSCILTGHRAPISSLVVSQGILHSGSWDGTIRLWLLSDHSFLAVLENNGLNGISSVLSISVGNSTIAAAQEDGTVKLWRYHAIQKSIHVGAGPVISVAIKGRWLFAGSWNKTIHIWELCLDDRELDVLPVGVIKCHSVGTCLLDRNGVLCIGYSDKVIKAYDLHVLRGTVIEESDCSLTR